MEQTPYTVQIEIISDDILREAGVCDGKLSMEELRTELYELEPEIAALRGKLAGMRKEYDRIRGSLRFSLIMTAVFFLFDLLVKTLHDEMIGMLAYVPEQGAAEFIVPSMAVDIVMMLIGGIFRSGLSIFVCRALYMFFRFLRASDGEFSRWWCSHVIKKENLSDEIFHLEMQLAHDEERFRQLKQVRTIYRERMQEEWLEENLPERVAAERALP